MVTSHEAAQPLLAKGNASHRADAESIVAVANSLRAEGFDASEDGTGRQNLVPVANSGDVSYAICASGQQSLDAETETLIAFDCKGSQVHHDGGGASPTLRAMADADGHANGGGQLAVAVDLNQITSATNRSNPDPAVHHTLPASSCPPHLATPWAVRRLTPNECERLQGFPDNWTQIPWRGKPAEQCPDGRRYKALGNSWGVNAGEYIFDRMRWVESL